MAYPKYGNSVVVDGAVGDPHGSNLNHLHIINSEAFKKKRFYTFNLFHNVYKILLYSFKLALTGFLQAKLL